MPFIKAYDEIYDEVYQFEIPDNKRHLVDRPEDLTEEPDPNYPVVSSSRADRHPEGEWDKYWTEEDYTEAHKNGPCCETCPLHNKPGGVR